MKNGLSRRMKVSMNLCDAQQFGLLGGEIEQSGDEFLRLHRSPRGRRDFKVYRLRITQSDCGDTLFGIDLSLSVASVFGHGES